MEQSNYCPRTLFTKIFHTDILQLKSMHALWEERKAPQELDYARIESGQDDFGDASLEAIPSADDENNANCVERDQQLWSARQCLRVFQTSLAQLAHRFQSQQKLLTWDKDDEVAVDFVTAVSNFRSHCFDIERKSKFDVKSLAGSIIPAIATTNSIVGGYVLAQTCKLLESMLPFRIWKTQSATPSKEDLDHEASLIHKNCFAVHISNTNQKVSKLVLAQVDKPLPHCMACSSNAQTIVVALDFQKTTLGMLVDGFIRNRLRCAAPDVRYSLKSSILWLADDELDLDDPSVARRKGKLLSELDLMVDGVLLNVADLKQKFEVIIKLKNVDPHSLKSAAAAATGQPNTNGSDGDDWFSILNQGTLDSIHQDLASAQVGDQNGGGPLEVETEVRDLPSKTNDVVHVDEDDDFEITLAIVNTSTSAQPTPTETTVTPTNKRKLAELVGGDDEAKEENGTEIQVPQVVSVPQTNGNGQAKRVKLDD